MRNQLERTNQAYKALAHPARMRMLAMLKGGELCLCQLTAVLELAPSTVSAHLAELRRVGLVVERKAGRWVHVRLARTPAVRRVLELLWKQLRGDVQVANDAAAVKKLRKVPVEELCSMSRFQVRRTMRKAKARRGRNGD